jgi:hypothetical protein
MICAGPVAGVCLVTIGTDARVETRIWITIILNRRTVGAFKVDGTTITCVCVETIGTDTRVLTRIWITIILNQLTVVSFKVDGATITAIYSAGHAHSRILTRIRVAVIIGAVSTGIS